jgi:hypothetical protein
MSPGMEADAGLQGVSPASLVVAVDNRSWMLIGYSSGAAWPRRASAQGLGCKRCRRASEPLWGSLWAAESLMVRM